MMGRNVAHSVAELPAPIRQAIAHAHAVLDGEQEFTPEEKAQAIRIVESPLHPDPQCELALDRLDLRAGK